MRRLAVKTLLLACVMVMVGHAQFVSNRYQFCDQEATSICMILKAPASMVVSGDILTLAGPASTNDLNLGLSSIYSLAGGVGGNTIWALAQLSNFGILKLADGTGAGALDGVGTHILLKAVDGSIKTAGPMIFCDQEATPVCVNLQAPASMVTSGDTIILTGPASTNTLTMGLSTVYSLAGGVAGDTIFALAQLSNFGQLKLADGTNAYGVDSAGTHILLDANGGNASLDGSVKFYEAGSPTTHTADIIADLPNQLSFLNSSAVRVMSLTTNFSAGAILTSPSLVTAPTSTSVVADTIYGYPSGSVDLMDVYLYFGGTKEFWIDNTGGTHIANCVAGCSGGGFWLAGTGSSIYYPSGNVGIGAGVSNPLGPLDVEGGRSYFTAANEPYAIAARYNASGQFVYFGAESAVANPNAGIYAATGANLMTLEAGGNVGIGTQTPANGLEVTTTIQADVGFYSANSASNTVNIPNGGILAVNYTAGVVGDYLIVQGANPQLDARSVSNGGQLQIEGNTVSTQYVLKIIDTASSPGINFVASGSTLEGSISSGATSALTVQDNANNFRSTVLQNGDFIVAGISGQSVNLFDVKSLYSGGTDYFWVDINGITNSSNGGTSTIAKFANSVGTSLVGADGSYTYLDNTNSSWGWSIRVNGSSKMTMASSGSTAFSNNLSSGGTITATTGFTSLNSASNTVNIPNGGVLAVNYTAESGSNNIVIQTSSPQIDAVSLGAALNINGSGTVNGNIVLNPGIVSSVGGVLINGQSNNNAHTQTLQLNELSTLGTGISLSHGGTFDAAWQGGSTAAFDVVDNSVTHQFIVLQGGVVLVHRTSDNGSGALLQVQGGISYTGNLISSGSTGLTCSGTPTSSFATVNGIVTHC